MKNKQGREGILQEKVLQQRRPCILGKSGGRESGGQSFPRRRFVWRPLSFSSGALWQCEKENGKELSSVGINKSKKWVLSPDPLPSYTSLLERPMKQFTTLMSKIFPFAFLCKRTARKYCLELGMLIHPPLSRVQDLWPSQAAPSFCNTPLSVEAEGFVCVYTAFRRSGLLSLPSCSSISAQSALPGWW